MMQYYDMIVVQLLNDCGMIKPHQSYNKNYINLYIHRLVFAVTRKWCRRIDDAKQIVYTQPKKHVRIKISRNMNGSSLKHGCTYCQIYEIKLCIVLYCENGEKSIVFVKIGQNVLVFLKKKKNIFSILIIMKCAIFITGS